MSQQEDHGKYPVEVEYIEAAIEALCIDRPEEEAVYIRKCGNAILNIAVKTKKKVENANKAS